jgi:hypothetical protein
MSAAKFGRLTVLGEAPHRSADGRVMWQLRCDCGTEFERTAKVVKNGNTKSCGCLAREMTAARNRANATHGMSNTSTHNVWTNMKERCLNPNHKSFNRYGGRGITICQRWLDSFQNFLDDMGTMPIGMSLDRKDVNGNYEPGNCRWATSEEQANNKANNRVLEFKGKKQTIAQWAREVGMSREALRHRLNAGWSSEDALTMKLDHANNNHWRAAA